MTTTELAYIKLQRHLDSQAVGFPATKSGAEIRILKHIFTPIEAEAATCLSFRFESLETIFNRAGYLVESPEQLEKLLDSIEKKGGIELKIKEGKKLFCNAPLVVGMFEFQLGKLTPEFIEDFNEYTATKKFGVDFLSTELPQMRTIPIAESIQPQHNVSTFDEVADLMQKAEAPFAIFACICRQKKSLAGEPCQITDREETCLAVGDMAQGVLRQGLGREITRDEAISIIEQNQKQGLVLQPSNTEKAEFICSCCGCCCGMIAMHKNLPKPVDFWATNFYTVIDNDACNGCGICAERCQVGAATVALNGPAVIDLNRCIGCGLCVPSCPTQALSLQRKNAETKPPQTREELYDIIMANKKGGWGKLKLTGKLFIDAIRTGQINLLK